MVRFFKTNQKMKHSIFGNGKALLEWLNKNIEEKKLYEITIKEE